LKGIKSTAVPAPRNFMSHPQTGSAEGKLFFCCAGYVLRHRLRWQVLDRPAHLRASESVRKTREQERNSKGCGKQFHGFSS
jgi:hypothetical protein